MNKRRGDSFIWGFIAGSCWALTIIVLMVLFR